jgi:hypothetical protein
MKKGSKTPWGRAALVRAIGTIGRDTIYCVSTPGHGGYFVPRRLLSAIPQALRDRAAAWSGSEQWYEEDCEWSSVALAFPQFFTAADVQQARTTQANYGSPEKGDVCTETVSR